jgi:hypothetical protein
MVFYKKQENNTKRTMTETPPQRNSKNPPPEMPGCFVTYSLVWISSRYPLNKLSGPVASATWPCTDERMSHAVHHTKPSSTNYYQPLVLVLARKVLNYECGLPKILKLE